LDLNSRGKHSGADAHAAGVPGDAGPFRLLNEKSTSTTIFGVRISDRFMPPLLLIFAANV